MKTKNKIILLLIFILVLSVALISSQASAQNQYRYTPMESIPGFEYDNATSSSQFKSLVEGIYKFGIWTVGIAALLMIIIGGFMYMTSAGNTAKAGTAKSIIWDAIYGLIIALFAWLILNVINPDLVSININMPLIPNPNPGGAATNPANPSSSQTLPTRPTQPSTTQGSCAGMGTQYGIATQCGDASSELTSLLNCISSRQPNAVISSISDSQGLANCQTNYSRPPCAHAQYSCHYGGRDCRAAQRSYGVDFTTRNVSATELMAAGRACNASFVLNEGNHVHMSVGNCGCR